MLRLEIATETTDHKLTEIELKNGQNEIKAFS